MTPMSYIPKRGGVSHCVVLLFDLYIYIYILQRVRQMRVFRVAEATTNSRQPLSTCKVYEAERLSLNVISNVLRKL